MSLEPSLPVMLLAGVNRPPEPKLRRQIDQELASIEHALQPGRKADGLQLLTESPQEGQYLFDYLRQHQYQAGVAIVHLTGPLQGRYLRFEGGLGEDTMDPIGFADVLGRLPGLQVVFLHGCGHRELIEQLLLRNIPAVVSLGQEGPQRKQLRDISTHFYSQLLQGKGLREAWLAVQVEFAGKLVFRKVHYDLDTDTLNWKGRDPDRPQAEWGLYVLEQNEPMLEWTLPGQGPSTAAARQTAASSKSYAWRKIVFWALTLLLLIAGAGLMYVFDLPSQMIALFRQDRPCVFPDANTYNILQLPLHPGGDCKSTDPFLADAIQRRLERLADRELEDIEVRYLSERCPVQLDEAEALIRQCQADLILWGEYDKSVKGEVLFHFSYLYTTGAVSLDRGEVTVRIPLSQLDADNDFINSGIEEVVFWARGNFHVSRQEFEEALTYFTRIQESYTENYFRVDVRMAQCYKELQMYEQALTRYDHMLAIHPDNAAAFNDRGQLYFKLKDHAAALLDFNQAILLRPDFADALFNRGLLYLEQGSFSEAISDLQTVVRIQPGAGHPYAALAAVYAELKDTENVYVHLERALERGENLGDIQQSFSSIRRYKQEDRFLQLAEKFR